MKSGELFAGVGGLGVAVDEVFGTRPAWVCEFDAAPSKVLAHRHPDVPNYGDVTKVDWVNTPHVDVLAGGFPCQDVSLAGARRGMKDGTRSGLWAEYVKAIDTIRPDWVVIENVGGLLSAEAHSDVEPCPWCLGDDPTEPALRALGAVHADLAALGFDAEWTSIRASDVGAPHGRLRVFILAWPAERTLADPSGERQPVVIAGGSSTGPSATAGDSGDASVTLLPTPAAGLHNDGESVESWSARRDRVKATGVNGNGMGMPLPIAVQLLPTPTAAIQTKSARAMTASRENGRRSGGGQSSPLGLEEAASLVAGVRPEHLPQDALLPPASLAVVQALLPTPGAYDGERGGSQHPDKRRGGGHSVTLQDVAEHTMNWGPYAAAIRRWEAVTGRPAPAPVRNDRKGGKPRLNPALTEWMMGWPAGWVTDPAIGLSRAEQLKACGNGVVPQQAAAALRELLARPGVPPIRQEVAA